MTYLYIKTHNKTGLQYFGKFTGTERRFKKYKGSGLYWKRHIKKHGYDVTTNIYSIFDINNCNIEDVALDFSIENNIVDSKEWANLVLENGLDGSLNNLGKKLCNDGILQKYFREDDIPHNFNIGSIYEYKWYNDDINEYFITIKNSKNLKLGRLKKKGEYYNNGKELLLIMNKINIPKGFVKGGIISKVYNNGIIERRFKTDDIIPENFNRGMLKLGKWYNNGEMEKRFRINEPITKGFELGQIIVTCPHCLTKCNKGNAKRWHFNNCKKAIDVYN